MNINSFKPNKLRITMENKDIYDYNFYEGRKTILDSAEVIVPLVLKVIRPKSIVDVGCARGEFLSIFYKNGIKDLCGLDGEWINKEQLIIDGKDFMPVDLRKPLDIGRKFDLAVSLEVAEHLPEESAEIFIKSLTRLSPIVLFSAAVYGQGGVNHLNEQFQDYWSKLFKKEGYVAVDFIRKQVWDNEKVCFYYAQNILMYVKENYLNKNKNLRREFEKTNQSFISIIHPRMYYPVIEKQKKIGRMLPKPIKLIAEKFVKNVMKC